jgi:hypothetical protein
MSLLNPIDVTASDSSGVDSFLLDLVHPDDVPAVIIAMTDSRRAPGRVRTDEVRVRHKDAAGG